MSSPWRPSKIEERRGHFRESAERELFLTVNGFSWTCRLVDFTPVGARVTFAGAAAWPDLVVLADPSTGTAYRARIAWRTEHDVGLEFLEEGSLTEMLMAGSSRRF